ncbi:hypothetical protein B9K06_18820 [Bacillus sp. OG2]|nr:hypothetical protein B9K06_18820 [Bacillus sp. OG2]
MKGFGRLSLELIFAIPVCGSAWDYLKKVCNGFSDGTVSLDKTPATELLTFLFVDWFWLIFGVYALIRLSIFVYKKIQHANAERKEKKNAKRKKEFFDWLDEYNNNIKG